jgi:hypothetical protein
LIEIRFSAPGTFRDCKVLGSVALEACKLVSLIPSNLKP